VGGGGWRVEVRLVVGVWTAVRSSFWAIGSEEGQREELWVYSIVQSGVVESHFLNALPEVRNECLAKKKAIRCLCMIKGSGNTCLMNSQVYGSHAKFI
jgi:hypothetical protein